MFIKSNYPYEVIIAGVLIPKRMYTGLELSNGKRSFVEVSNEKLEELKKDGVFQCLLNSNKYTIIDKIPLELLSPVDKVKQLEQKNKEALTEKDIEIKNLKQANDKLLKENIKLKGNKK